MTVTTTDLSSGYAPPGVYIAEQSQPISTATGLPPARLTLLGRGQGAQSATEQVTLSDDGVRLAVKGINEGSVEVRAVSDDSVISPTDYTLEQEVVSDASSDYYYRLTRASGATAPSGTTVWVSYTYIPVGYDEPRVYTTPSDVAAMYGPALSGDAENPVNSPLTLAAELAFANGAGQIVIVPLDVAPGAASADVLAALNAGYDKISADYSSTVVVPLTDGLDATDAVSAGAALRGHVNTMSAQGYYRIGIFGAPLTYTSAPTELVNTGGLVSPRLIVAYASEQGLVYRSNADGTRVNLGHQYLAAALAGRMVSLPVARSLTRQAMTGFMDIGGSLNATTKNTYAASGILLVEKNRQGRIIVRHGTSTDRSNLAASEPSVVRARDVMIAMVQTGLDSSDLIGSAMDENSALSVKSVVSGVLEYVTGEGVIVDYSNLQVRVQSLNPSVIEVRFAYRPSFPLNYIMVNFAIDLSTGEADLDDTTGLTV